ncbi:MAG: BatA domain-containing protein [bacterium]
MLRFLNPATLYFLPLALLPVIIHLLTRKKAVPFAFPSIFLLKKDALARTVNLNLINIILLLLRTLIIILLVLFFAAPSVVFLKAKKGVKSAAVFLDYSYSMNRRFLETTVWKESLAAVSRIMDVWRAENISVFTFNKKVFFEGRGGAALSILRRKEKPYIESGQAGKEIAQIIRRNRDIGSVFIISDFGRNTFINPVEAAAAGKITCFKMGSPGRNFFVEGFSPREDAVSVRLKAIPPAEADYSVYLYSEGKKINQSSVPAGAAKALLMTQGKLSGRILLSNEDILPCDNVFYFSLPRRNTLQVPCLNGSPSMNAVKNETYFLRKIFEQVPFLDLNVVTDKEVFFDNYGNSKAGIICNVDAITEKQGGILRRQVLNGGILIVFLGEKTDVDVLNSVMPDILPAYIYPVKEEKLLGMEYISAPWLKKDLSSLHFTEFRAEKYFPVLPCEGASVIMKSGGNPVCVAKAFGEGGVILFSVSSDMDFSNLPVQTGFPAFILASMNYFIWEKNEFRRNYFIGDRVEDPDPRAKLFSGSKEISLSKEIRDNQILFVSPPLDETGLYSVKTGRGGGGTGPDEKIISVNLRRGSENDLTGMSERAIGKIFPGADVFNIKNPARDIPLILSGKPLRNFLLLACLLLFLAECAISVLWI